MFNLTKLLYNFVKMSGTYSGGVERERAAAEGGMVHIRNTNSTDLPDSTNQNKIGFLQTGCNIDVKIKNSLCSGYSVWLRNITCCLHFTPTAGHFMRNFLKWVFFVQRLIYSYIGSISWDKDSLVIPPVGMYAFLFFRF